MGYISFTLSVRSACGVRSVAPCLFHWLYSHVAQIHPTRGWCVTYHFQVNRSKVKVTWVIRIFVVGGGSLGILVDHWSAISVKVIPPTQQSCGGVYWFHSVRPSIRLAVRPAFRVRSVAPRVLVGSISYLYILSSNIIRCVACKVLCKILIFGNFFKFVTLTLSSFDLGFDVNH